MIVVILVLSKCDGVCEICEPVVCALPFTLSLGSECVIGILFFTFYLREPFKFFFADFVRKGGGGTPQIHNPLFAGKKIRKGGGGNPPSGQNPQRRI